ncbi:uncharacterized protein LOC119092581 [Pollicipes pollicipes]|uniref:uncharacterized protein LOC119092581 n=1 Tax=Pollicipes pollicipes TaxID=41117 RepID=UPI001884E62F|nr:uncharacterized protein LOC119092581 [Pollicipes pollicipes]
MRGSARSLAELAARIYPDLSQNIDDTEWLEERAILTVFNAGVKRINDHVIDRPPGPGHVYTSVDSMSDPDAVPLATEVLNGIELSGTPAHCIRLKAGAPVLLMRNLDAPSLIIGTLCVTVALSAAVLELKNITGPDRSHVIAAPRIPIESTPDSGLVFSFRRL